MTEVVEHRYAFTCQYLSKNLAAHVVYQWGLTAFQIFRSEDDERNECAGMRRS